MVSPPAFFSHLDAYFILRGFCSCATDSPERSLICACSRPLPDLCGNTHFNISSWLLRPISTSSGRSLPVVRVSADVAARGSFPSRPCAVVRFSGSCPRSVNRSTHAKFHRAACLVLSCLVLSCLVLSCPVLSCLVSSHRVLSCMSSMLPLTRPVCSKTRTTRRLGSACLCWTRSSEWRGGIQ